MSTLEILETIGDSQTLAKKLTKPQLVKLCESMGIASTGTKMVLADRLLENYNESDEDDDDWGEEGIDWEWEYYYE